MIEFNLKKAFILFSFALLMEGAGAAIFYGFIYYYFVMMWSGLIVVILALVFLLLLFLGILPRKEKSYTPNFFLCSMILNYFLSMLFLFTSLYSINHLFIMILNLTLAIFSTYTYKGLKKSKSDSIDTLEK